MKDQQIDELREKIGVIIAYSKAGRLSDNETINQAMSLFTHQLELAKIEARKEYHNEITDNEKKVWLYRKDLDKRLIEARLSECQSWKCKNSDNTSAIEKRVSELIEQKDLLTKESK